MFISLDEAKSYMRIDADYTENDGLITDLINGAVKRCAAVARNDDFESDPNAKIAVLYTVAYLYEHREDANNNELNLSLRALLFAGREEKF